MSNSTTGELNSTTWSVSLKVTLRALGGRELELAARELAALAGLELALVGRDVLLSVFIGCVSKNVNNFNKHI